VPLGSLRACLHACTAHLLPLIILVQLAAWLFWRNFTFSGSSEEDGLRFATDSTARLTVAQDMLHVLVTGGAGFIGSHAAMLLLETGHTVTIVDNLSRGNLGAVKVRGQRPSATIRTKAGPFS
jgi:hypothetical protein